jgi:hypothetical protein
MGQVMGIDMSSTVVVVVVARTESKRHIKTTSSSLLHAGEVALTASRLAYEGGGRCSNGVKMC